MMDTVRTGVAVWDTMAGMGNMIAIDAGSKTIKVVVLDSDGTLLYSLYRRHLANIRETVQDALHELVWRYGDIEGSVAITGSAGIGLSELLGLPFVQEVIATTHMVNVAMPDADAIIELGGEDAKVVYLSGGLEQRMNASCAGGTGGFIDTIAFMLGVRAQDMSSLSMGASKVYPIASRCAVFAQTDVRPLLYSGAQKSDIAASVLEAVVRQTITGLACGRQIKGKVVFLGGPLEHIPDLVIRFRQALGLTYKTGIKPHEAHLYTAMGAALLGPEQLKQQGLQESYSLEKLERRLDQAPPKEADLQTLPPLFSSVAEREGFRARHHTVHTPRRRLSACEGPLYLGIDAGSTTVKFAVVNKQKALVYSDYRPTEGDTLKTASEMLKDFYRMLPREYNGHYPAWIGHATITGYGEDLLKAAFNIDSGMVETVAHFRAAQQLCPEVDFILDIGGQDMKALWLRDGIITHAVLNEACSSGCGSFIEGTAHSLRFDRYTFADAALASQAPVDLGIKCTVFMTSRVRHAQKSGVPHEDIAAGIAYSVVKNALFKIIGMNNRDEMGKSIVVQGGTFMSDAVLRAFELVSEKQVFRPDIAHLMGAYGAAITACATGSSQSTLISPKALASLAPAKQMQRCTGCANACPLTVLEFDSERLFVSGNRCSRALTILEKQRNRPRSTTKPALRKMPNLYELEQKVLKQYGRRGGSYGRQVGTSNDGAGISSIARIPVTLGIPRVLHLYENIPFWHTLFTRLGFTVVLPSSTIDEDSKNYSPVTPGSKPTTRLVGYAHSYGLETVPSESVCFPAKMTHTHIAELVNAEVDAIFMPLFVRGSRCPVSSHYASVLDSNIPQLVSGEVALVSPELNAIRPEKICRSQSDQDALFDAINALPGLEKAIDREAFESALKIAEQEQQGFLGLLERATQKALRRMKAEGRRGIVLAGRPYHVDGSSSHGIDTILTDLGFAVFSLTGLRSSLQEAEPYLLRASPAAWEGVWKPAKPLERLAYYVNSQPELDLIYIYSFGCGFDAITLASVRAIIEGAGKIFTALKIDEIVDHTHIRIRLRTFAETLDGHTPPALPTGENLLDTPPTLPSGASPLDAPPFSTQETNRLQKTARLGKLCQEDIEYARSLVTHDVCFVTSVIAGAAINLLNKDPDITQLVLPYVSSKCLLDSVPDLIHEALGWTPEIVWEESWINEPLATKPGDESSSSRQEDESLASYQGDESQVLKQQGEPPSPPDRPRVGIIGNVLLCFDEYANHHIGELIEELGCTVVYPLPQALFSDEVSYLEQIETFMDQGIRDIIYLQAFGCLKGHIESRGAIRSLTRRFPGLRMTIVDFDHDLSTLNQENRIRLALTAALSQR